MAIVHHKEKLRKDDKIRVHLNQKAKVYLMDEDNFLNFLNGKPYKGIGALVSETPYYVKVPKEGEWILMVSSKCKGINCSYEIINNNGKVHPIKKM